jgi:hypothetical protein
VTDKKKDLTRIEDLGEFFHEENGADFPDFTLEETPSENPEETDFSGLDFGTTEEFPAEATEETPLEEDNTPFTLSEEEPKEDLPLMTEDEPIADLVEETLFGNNESDKTRSLSFETPPLEEPTPTPVYTPEPVFRQPETFEEVKRFAEESSFSGMGAEGNPSFSVLVRNVKFVEDVNDILILLKDLQLLTDSEEETRKRLSKGHLLVPRISEFAAIILTHKLRRFDIDIQMGLSDEIHPPKHHEAPEAGLSSKHTLHQNQHHNFHFDHPKLEVSQVIVSATPTLQGYQVIRYLGVASEHKTVPAEMVEDESNDEVPRYYQELAQKLRAHAVKAHSNAIVGLNYQLTPIPSEYGGSGHKYRLSCTGNLVWVNKL